MRRLQFNMEGPLTSNLDFRLAVLYALDRDQILEEAFGGFGTPVNTRVPPGSIWHTVAIPPRERDLDRSRELQQQAGYQGEEFTITSRRGHEDFAEPIHRMMTEAGFNVHLEIVEAAVVDDRRARGQFDMMTQGADLHPEPGTSMRANYYCEEGLELRADNEMGYCNPEVDRILDELVATADPDQRLELFRQFNQITYDDAVMLYVGTEPRYFGVSESVQGFQPTPGGGYIHHDGGGLMRAWLAP